MRRATHFMWALYAVLALGLLRCALVAYQAHSPGYTALFAAAAIGAALAIVHSSWLLDEYQHLLDRADTDERARARANAADVEVGMALARVSCCELAWTSLGAEHEPATCTRKDQTT